MSVSVDLSGAVQLPVSKLLDTTGATDLLTGNYAVTRETRSVMASAAIVNTDNSAVVVTLEYNDGASDFAFFRKSVGANSTEYVLGFPIRLKDGDWTIKATAASANVVTVTLVLVNQTGQIR